MRRAFQNVRSDFVAVRPGVEDFDGQRGYLVLPGLLDPVNQIIRRIELEFAQYLLTELRPCAFAVVIINHGLQRAQPDFKTAAFVAENMAPAAHFGGLAVPGAGEATRAGAAQHEHLDGNGARRAPSPPTLMDRRGRVLGGHERRFQIVRRITRNTRPDFGSGAANSFAVGFRTRAGHADGNRGRRGRRIGECLKLTDQLRVAQKAKIGWSEFAFQKTGRLAFRDNDGRMAATAFDPEKPRRRGRFPTSFHPPKYFRVGLFCKANGCDTTATEGCSQGRRKRLKSLTQIAGLSPFLVLVLILVLERSRNRRGRGGGRGRTACHVALLIVIRLHDIKKSGRMALNATG